MFHLFVPCIAEAVSQDLIVKLIEFIQHHILLGVSHIVMGFPYSRESNPFGLVLQSLISFVSSKHLTIVSLHDHSKVVTKLTSVLGILKYKRISNMIFNNFFLYLSKGVADHVGIWETDLYFIPQSPALTIPGVLSTQRNEDGTPLPGDDSAHPNCQYSVPIRVVRDYNTVAMSTTSYSWVGNRYSSQVVEVGTASPSAVILSTDTVYRVGISGFGEACRLPSQWTRCKQDNVGSVDRLSESSSSSFCLGRARKADRQDVSLLAAVHDFDDGVYSVDIRQLGHQRGGFLVRYIDRGVRDRKKRLKSTVITNEYKTHFFDNVLQELKNRGVEIFNSLPIDDTIEASVSSLESNWVTYKHPFPTKSSPEQFIPPPVIPKRSSKTAAGESIE